MILYFEWSETKMNPKTVRTVYRIIYLHASKQKSSSSFNQTDKIISAVEQARLGSLGNMWCS